jgi:hypothetical protein
MKAPELDPLPIACSLGTVELRDRRGEWRRVLEQGGAEVQPTPAGVRIAFRADEDVAADLRRLATLESECCPFARWTVRAGARETALLVESEGEGAAAVRAMFGLAPSGAA